MKVTYLAHSGFLVETSKAYYLFDYIRGELPNWKKGKPLYVLVSHSHKDHFCTEIFSTKVEENAVAYILSYDIRKKFRKTYEEWGQAICKRIYWAEPEKKIELPDCVITSLKSTDIGVAFVVTEGETVLYHAGDLNWWHWEGESKAWNRNMEVNYKREIDRLMDKKITIAFVPLDSRLGEAYRYGIDYFIDKVDAKVIFPMHFWEENEVIERYILESGNQNIMKIQTEGQEYEID
jgi:L-ascorbate metabolism protein UlaG (beta-lactamase superfamily)